MLKGKVVIVTGAAKGIGLGVARMMAKNGADVVVSDRDPKASETIAQEISKEFGVKAIGVKCDVSVIKDIKALVRTAFRKFKRIDVLVNNAGIYPYKPVLEINEKEWDRLMDVNLKGLFFLSQESAKMMVSGGRIINISSIASVQAFPGLSHYCSSKGGVNALTRGMALELSAKGINVNAILPGAIDTPGASGSMDKKAKAKTASMIPLKRWGVPEDIAGAAVFLASDMAGYITGQTLVVDGGWTIQ